MLPRMTWGNWISWSTFLFIGIIFLWLGWLELYLPIWVGALVAFGAALALFIYGPREQEESQEGEE